MKHTFEQRVFYGDTDAWGVVWHGSYVKWLEMGRILWCEAQGHTMKEFEEQNIVMPVTNLNIRYKRSAKLNDIIVIETELKECNGTSAVFHQEIKVNNTGKTFITADVEIVTVETITGKMYRKMPEILLKLFTKELE